MNYVFLVLGMPFNGQTISDGKSLGGSESAAYYVAKEIASQGNEVIVFANIPQDMEGKWDGVTYLSAGEINEGNQLGANFMFYATHTPHDVLVIQRHPLAFSIKFASKVNIWWTHDLALKRHAGAINNQLWNIDKVLAVSDFHANQLQTVYGMDNVGVLPNGVDSSLFNADIDPEERLEDKVMIYTSRPERGLEHLVAPGGIMDQLKDKDPTITLKVAGYDNTTPDMARYYQTLWDRCKEMPNVELLGALSKQDLAYLMSTAWLHVYPTTFEETSCITAMEEQTAGTPFMATPIGALPETLKDCGVKWISLDGEGKVDRAGFVKAILSLSKNPNKWRELHETSVKVSKRFTWKKGAKSLTQSVKQCLIQNTKNKQRLFQHFLYNSDIMVANKYATAHNLKEELEEIKQHYGYVFDGTYQEHYNKLAKWEQKRGIGHGLGSENLYRMPRFQPVLNALQGLPDGSKVLDYACGQGHFTHAAAKAFPKLTFVGVDISKENIKVGKAFLKENPQPNIKLHASEGWGAKNNSFDLVIASEILEHVPDPGKFADNLEGFVVSGGKIIVTTPQGPWEASTYETHPHRMHIHHLELADLKDIFGGKPGFNILHAYVEPSQRMEALGYYATTWQVFPDNKPSGQIDYQRKISTQAPKEMLSVCMIVKPDGDTLAKTLETVKIFADEIIIGIDKGIADFGHKEGRAWKIAEEFGAKVFAAKSPLEIGFDEARNETLKRASGDWILWIDDDETFEWPYQMAKYLRPNGFDSYAIKQHHYAAEPPGVIKTDLPCRMFRRSKDTRFFGFVHEHPEKGGMNKGCGKTFVLPDVAICHNGYSTEDIRRRRFERNIPLMHKDREKYPERKLGIMLWIRDLAHMNRYEMEANGGQISQQIIFRSEEGIKLWRGLLSNPDGARLAVDSLPYLSECVNVITQGNGVDFSLSLGVNHMGMGNMNGEPPPAIGGKFLNKSDIKLFTKTILEDSTRFLSDGGGYM